MGGLSTRFRPVFSRFELPDSLCRFVAVHLGHLSVHQDQVVGRGCIRCEGLCTVLDRIDNMPDPLEHRLGNRLID